MKDTENIYGRWKLYCSAAAQRLVPRLHVHVRGACGCMLSRAIGTFYIDSMPLHPLVTGTIKPKNYQLVEGDGYVVYSARVMLHDPFLEPCVRCVVCS